MTNRRTNYEARHWLKVKQCDENLYGIFMWQWRDEHGNVVVIFWGRCKIAAMPPPKILILWRWCVIWNELWAHVSYFFFLIFTPIRTKLRKFNIVHFPCSCRIHTSLFPTNCTIFGLNAPTCFGYEPQPSSGSCSIQGHIQRVMQLVTPNGKFWF